MDWKGVRIWSLFLLALCPCALGKASPGTESQNEAGKSTKEVPELSESKLVYLTSENSNVNLFHNNSSSVSNRNPAKEESAVFQIETPVIIKKIRRRFRTIRKDEKSSKVHQNGTSEDLNTEPDKHSTSASHILVPEPEESLRVEETRANSDDSSESSSNERYNSELRHNENFAPAHFVPSQDFPKKIISQPHQDSSIRTSVPVGNGRITYALNIPDSSEESSRSDTSSERFESKRRRYPPGFSDHQVREFKRNPLQEDAAEGHQNNPFPPEAQKVTIVKEKTVHSTSSEAAQERVNIERNPAHNQHSSEIHLSQEGRSYHGPQVLNNVATQNLNNQDEKIILIEGTHIPGRNYGPADDTFGFYSNSYKEETPSPQPPNRRKVKIVKVVKAKEQIPSNIPLNNHGNGQSRQYFVQNDQPYKEEHEQPPGNPFINKEQTSDVSSVPAFHQNGENNFTPNHHTNTNTRQTPHAIQQNLNFNGASKNHAQNNNDDHAISHDSGEQPILLNINPDPSELYIDENTGQLIRFVIKEDVNQPSDLHAAGKNIHNENPSQNSFSKFPEAQIGVGGQFHQKGTSQIQTHTQGALGKQNFDRHSSANGFINKFNPQQDNNQYVPVSHNNDIHLNTPGGVKGQQQVYHIPQDQTSKQQYVQGGSDSKENSEEYIILCDKEAQDYSAEYQSQDIGSEKHGLNTGGNNYKQTTFPTHNQFQGAEHESSGINHNKGHPFNSGSHGENSGSYNKGTNNVVTSQENLGAQGHYKGSEFSGNTNLAAHQGNFGAQGHYKGSEFSDNNKFTSSEENAGVQGHYKGSEFSNDSGVTNFATPQSNIGAQGHYKGSEFSNNKGTNVAVTHISEAPQGHYKGSEFSNNKGGTNFAVPQSNAGNQAHYKGSEFSDNNKFTSSQGNSGVQGHYKGSEFSNDRGVTNFATPQSNIGAQGHYKGSEFSNNKGTNIAITHINEAPQGHYKGSEFSNNKGGTNFAVPQNNVGNQVHYKGSEFSNNKGVTNFAAPQINVGSQGHYGSSDYSNNGVTNFVTELNNVQGQSQYKDSKFANNQGDSDYTGQQGNAGISNNYKGSEISSNRGTLNFVKPQINVNTQGHYKGSKFSNNKGTSNFAIPNVNAGGQGHYKGSEFSNDKGISNFAVPQINQNQYKVSGLSNKGNTNFATPQINRGTQSHYKGSVITNNKRATNFVSPQDNKFHTQNHYKGSEFSNNKGDTNFAVLKINENHYKGMDITNNKGISNFAPPQINTGAQDHYKGSDFANNKGAAHFAPQGEQGQYKSSQFSSNGVINFPNPQLSVGTQGLSKGSSFSNTKQNSQMPVYRENVTPAYPVANDFHSAQVNTKGSNFQLSQNQGNYKGEIAGPISISPDSYNSGISNNKGYDTSNNIRSNNKGHDLGSGTLSLNGYNKGTQLSNPTRYENNQGYVSGQNLFSGINKGSEISSGKGYSTQSAGLYTDQGHNSGAQIKGSPIVNQKEYGSGTVNDQIKGTNYVNQKGYTSKNSGFSNNQNQNFEGKGYQQDLSLSQDITNSGIPSQNNYNRGNNLYSGGISSNTLSNNFPISIQNGYTTGNGAFPKTQSYNSGQQFIDSHSLKGEQGDLALLIQKGYNAESDVFPPNKAKELFSSKTPIKGSVFSSQNGYISGGNKGSIDSGQGYSIGNGAELFSGAISSKGFDKGSGFSNNKGLTTSSIPESYSGSFYQANSNKGSNQKGSNSFNNNYSGNQGYNIHSNAPSNNQGAHVYSENVNDFKGSPVQSQNNGYNNQINSLSAHNAFKGNNFQLNNGKSGYANQQVAGYGTGSIHNALQGQNNIGNNQFGVSYTSSEENMYQPDQQHSSNEGPIQLLLVEEDIPGHNKGNDNAVYYIQYENKDQSNEGNSQEQAYLVLDDSTLQQHPNLHQHSNLRVMVDGGKDKTFPLRQLATAGQHMARSVLPHIKKAKGKSISGKINFGIEIKKERDQSRKYLQSRSDEESDEDLEKDQTSEKEDKQLEDLLSRIDEETKEKPDNSQNSQQIEEKS